MRSKVVVVVLGLVAVVAVGWLVLGREGIEKLFGLSRDEARDEGGSLAAGGDGRDESAAADLAPRGGPALLGSKRIARVGQGALRGRVLDVKTAKGVAKASVHVTGTGLALEVVDARAESAADGGFVLNGLAAGEEYELAVEAPGLASLHVRGLVVRADQSTDVGQLWLGTPGTLEGVVLDPAGQGVVGAEVQLHRGIGSLREFIQSGGLMDLFANMDRAPEPLQRTTSRAKGAFRLEGASPGPVALVVRAPGFRQAVVSLTLTADAGHEPVKVQLTAGARLSGKVVDGDGRGMDGVHLAAFSADGGMPTPFSRTFAQSGPGGAFQFASLPGEGDLMVVAAASGFPTAFAQASAGDADVLLTLKRGATLEVRILGGEPATPIAGAQVLIAVGDDAKMDDGPGSLMGALTDAAGVAVLEVRPGALQMAMVNAPGLPASFWSPDMAGAAMLGGGMTGPADPTIPEGRSSVEFHVPRGILVTGRVTDLDGAGLGGAEVVSVGFLGRGARTTSAPDGSFELRMGSSVIFGGGVQARLAGWVQGKVDKPDQPVRPDQPEVEEMEVPTEMRMDIRMRRAVSVSGRVLDPEGRAVAGAKVVVRAERESEGFDVGMLLDDDASTITLANGSYLVDGVPAEAKVRVLARREGFVEAGTEEFNVGKEGVTKAADLRLLSGATVKLRVVGPDGQGVAGARVKSEVARKDGVGSKDWEEVLESQSGEHDVRTGPAGTAEVPLLPPGDATFRVTAAGFAPTGTKLAIGAEGGPAEPIVVRVKPGITLAGRVLDGDGRPVQGAQVRVRNQDGAVSRAVPGAVPGAGEAREVNPDDQWSDNDWDSARRTTTDAQGQWRVADLPERELSVEASRDGFTEATVEVGEERARIEIRLVKQDPEVAKRIAEIEKQLMGIYQQVGSAKGEAQQALFKQIQELQAEKERLESGGK